MRAMCAGDHATVSVCAVSRKAAGWKLATSPDAEVDKRANSNCNKKTKPQTSTVIFHFEALFVFCVFLFSCLFLVCLFLFLFPCSLCIVLVDIRRWINKNKASRGEYVRLCLFAVCCLKIRHCGFSSASERPILPLCLYLQTNTGH